MKAILLLVSLIAGCSAAPGALPTPDGGVPADSAPAPSVDGTYALRWGCLSACDAPFPPRSFQTAAVVEGLGLFNLCNLITCIPARVYRTGDVLVSPDGWPSGTEMSWPITMTPPPGTAGEFRGIVQLRNGDQPSWWVEAIAQ